MFQLIIGLVVLYGLYVLVKSLTKPKSVEDKEDELKELELAHKVLDVEERIVDSTISLKERKKELKSKKEKTENA